ncbi:MAG: DUF481 domain-containing protein [Myxococcota bacterium]
MLSLMLFTSLAAAQTADADANADPDPPEPKLTYQVSASGSWISGNLRQVQLNANGTLRYTDGVFGNALYFNGYRIWTGFTPDAELTQIGDDVSVTDLPYYYIGEKVSIIGFAHYNHSQLHQIDNRWMGGAILGHSPFREKTREMHNGLGAFYERTSYPSDAFNRDVSQSGNVRAIARIGALSSGRCQRPKTRMTLNYMGWFHINPVEPEDFRGHLQATAAFHVIGPLSIRFNVNVTYNNVVVENVQTYDTQTVFGIQFDPPPDD